MQIKTISYQKVFPIAAYVNEKIGVELEVNEGEDPNELFQEAKALVNSWGTKVEDDMEIGHGMPLPKDYVQIENVQILKEEPLTQTQRIIQQIRECSDLKVLSSFELLAKNNPEVKSAYDKRLNELK